MMMALAAARDLPSVLVPGGVLLLPITAGQIVIAYNLPDLTGPVTYRPIPTGKFNTSFRVETPARSLILRIAPPVDSVFLFYERDMMRQEPGLHRLLLQKTTVAVPRILILVIRTRNKELFLLTVVAICLTVAWLTGLAGLPGDRLWPLRFETGELDFAVPGMSDVMPYPSSVWSRMAAPDLALYRKVWRDRISKIVNEFAPDIIHTNHLWLMSSLVPDAAPGVPVVAACHATGLRQMELCPALKDEVVRGCRRLDRFVVLRNDHRDEVARTLGVDPSRVVVTGAGYRDELFHPDPEPAAPGELLYVGKYSEAKGLPWLLDTFGNLGKSRPDLRLHVAGGGAGAEAESLRTRMEAMDGVVLHGMLDQQALADLMRRCSVCVLPSFYEGVPLVLVEAAACGCGIVATDLPGVREQIAPVLGNTLVTVPLPRLEGIDRPAPADLPRFTADLTAALAGAQTCISRSRTLPGVFAISVSSL